MNSLNRVLALLLFGVILVLAVLFLVCLIWPGMVPTLPLPPFEEHLSEIAINEARLRFWGWFCGAWGLILAALLLLILEIWTAWPERTLLLNTGAGGSTTVDLSAISQLARWVGEETGGVESMPATRVRKHGRTLHVTGLVLLNPYVNAQETALELQQKVQTSVARASGFPVRVTIRSRFQKPEAGRKPR